MGFLTGVTAPPASPPAITPGPPRSELSLRGGVAWIGLGSSASPISYTGRRLTVAVPFSYGTAGSGPVTAPALAAPVLTAHVLEVPVMSAIPLSEKPSGSLSLLLGRRLTVEDSVRVKRDPLG